MVYFVVMLAVPHALWGLPVGSPYHICYQLVNEPHQERHAKRERENVKRLSPNIRSLKKTVTFVLILAARLTHGYQSKTCSYAVYLYLSCQLLDQQ